MNRPTHIHVIRVGKICSASSSGHGIVCRKLLSVLQIVFAAPFLFFVLRSRSVQIRKVPVSTVEHAPLNRTVTVVTAYYRIPTPKHSDLEYLTWMGNFLTNIPCHLYIFTDQDSYGMLQALRAPHLSRTRFVIRPFGDLRMAQRGDSFWHSQFDIDPDQNIHTPRLYVVWNEKTKFVMDAIAENAFQSDYFMWCDIGSFRNAAAVSHFLNFPNVTTVTNMNSQVIYATKTGTFRKSDFAVGKDNLPTAIFSESRIGAGFLIGYRDAWQAWDKVYYDVLSRLAAAHRFVGNEQTVMANLAVLHPERVHLVRPRPYLNGTGNPWFYFQHLLS